MLLSALPWRGGSATEADLRRGEHAAAPRAPKEPSNEGELCGVDRTAGRCAACGGRRHLIPSIDMTSATLYRCDPPSLFICSAQGTGFHCEASKWDRKQTQRSLSAVICATRPLGIVRAIFGGFQCVWLIDHFVGEMGGTILSCSGSLPQLAKHRPSFSAATTLILCRVHISAEATHRTQTKTRYPTHPPFILGGSRFRKFS